MYKPVGSVMRPQTGCVGSTDTAPMDTKIQRFGSGGSRRARSYTLRSSFYQDASLGGLADSHLNGTVNNEPLAQLIPGQVAVL